MALDTKSPDFTRRFRDLQLNQDASNKLIKELIAHCEHAETSLASEKLRLSKEVDNLRLDLIDAVKSRRDLQQQVQLYEKEFLKFRSDHVGCPPLSVYPYGGHAGLSLSIHADTGGQQICNPYVAILIDGDGLIFQDEFIKGGVEGGKKAAQALRDAVAEQCNEMDVSAKIVTSIASLSKALVRGGIIEHWADLKDFTLGFTQAYPSFEFIDMGCDRDSAQLKITETTKWNLQNVNCQQVLLGISHDGSYASFLRDILQDELTRQRVTVLEGVLTAEDLVATRVNVFRIGDNIFRSDKMVDDGRASPADLTHEMRATVHSAPTPPASTSTDSPFSSYADIAQKARPVSPPPQLKLPLAPRMTSINGRPKSAQQQQQQQQPKWNPGPRGYDEPINVNPAVLEALKKRKDSSKLCNNHFLRGPCTRGSECPFIHKYKPTADELEAIAFLARLNPCTLGQDCVAEDCIYGHHCPNTKDNTCTHPYCKFPMSAHPPGTKYKNAHIDKN